MTTLFLDLETWSETPIAHGAHKYAEDSEVLLAAVAVDEGPVAVWDFTDGTPMQHESLQTLIGAADEIVIHNSAFDRTVLAHHGVVIPVEKIVDTMVLALQHSLPGGLGALCDVLGVPQDKAKDKDGKKLIQLFCKPLAKNRKLRRATRETHPEEWEAFKAYAALDVDAMRDVYSRLPRWNDSDSERGLWRLDQAVNDFGIAIDLDLARSAINAFSRTTRSLASRTSALTGGAVASLTQRDKFLAHLSEAHGFNPADMTKGTVAAQLKRDDLDDGVRELLEIRQQASATSPAKYKTLINATSSDGRLRGTIQFCGASRTGRDAGRIFQPQNLPRPTLKNDVIETGIAAMEADCEDLLFENVSELCASAVRGCVVAPPGKKLVVADLSNIEGRVLAWLAGEEWKLEAFRKFDAGIGHDLYVASYAKAFGISPEAVTKALRQVGKVMELAFGYQGSVGAFAKMGEAYGVTLPEDEVLGLVRAWRKAHPAIVRFWYALDDAAKSAIRNPGSAFEVRGLRFDMKGTWLRMRLPSGRFLSYPDAAIDPISGQVTYSGTNQYTRKWETIETYGGKFAEQGTQGTARDVFKHGQRLALEAGYQVVLPVHDENAAETPDTPDWTAKGLSTLMCKNPSWAHGLPLAAEGHEMLRYAKLD